MRVRFPPGAQRAFIERVLHVAGHDLATVAGSIGVCARTLRDWRREKWHMTESNLDRLCEVACTPQPSGIRLLPEHWSVEKAARLGGVAHARLYGSPGTPEGRRRGGVVAQRKFRAMPEHFRARGVSVRKPIRRPRPSADLAEFVGIVLGDGGVTRYQVIISLNRSRETPYSEFVRGLVTQLFGIDSTRVFDPEDDAMDLVVSSVELVEFLGSLGLKRGSKVRQQVDVPGWVWQDHAYQIGCLRGLMDTDGCFYRHHYRVNGLAYAYSKLCLTNYSRPILESAKRMFESLELFPTIHKDGHRLYLHSAGGVARYMRFVGTHNPHHRARYLESSQLIGRQ